ncbi:hypothetical protein EVAR_102695_1 [Eumeta japonica]|uniref:Uncharacterized protein n=1 Tax=Eumeta variegata TaxID=151549 RepID=A0A4C1TIQ7_EUMVA|nr:hypothetical protein EVAR_102695_1 [Eumeta japonica]
MCRNINSGPGPVFDFDPDHALDSSLSLTPKFDPGPILSFVSDAFSRFCSPSRFRLGTATGRGSNLSQLLPPLCRSNALGNGGYCARASFRKRWVFKKISTASLLALTAIVKFHLSECKTVRAGRARASDSETYGRLHMDARLRVP